MISLPKLLLIAVVILAVWYAVRWLNRPPAAARRRAQRLRPAPRLQAEDLVPCAGCGADVAQTARSCGRAKCPLPR
jgi:hypothetical protein